MLQVKLNVNKNQDPPLHSAYFPFTFHTRLFAGVGLACYVLLMPPITPDLAQACWETKFFVPVLLVALGSFPCCPMPAAVSSFSVKSPYPNPHIRPWPCSYFLVTCTLGFSLSLGQKTKKYICGMAEGAKEQKSASSRALHFLGVFKVGMVTTASFVGVPSLLQNQGACWT